MTSRAKRICRGTLAVVAWVAFFAWAGFIVLDQLRTRPPVPIPLDTDIAVTDTRLDFYGWSKPETGVRWSTTKRLSIRFYLGDVDPTMAYAIKLGLVGVTRDLGVQGRLNNCAAGNAELTPTSRDVEFLSRPQCVHPHAINELRLWVPTASEQDPRAWRVAGMGAVSMTVSPSLCAPQQLAECHNAGD